MSVLREYVKMKYVGDCKCGDCQLVPTKVLYEQNLIMDQLQDLVKTLLENDPDYPIADNGMTVLDGWRERARRVMSAANTPAIRGGE